MYGWGRIVWVRKYCMGEEVLYECGSIVWVRKQMITVIILYFIHSLFLYSNLIWKLYRTLRRYQRYMIDRCWDGIEISWSHRCLRYQRLFYIFIRRLHSLQCQVRRLRRLPITTQITFKWFFMIHLFVAKPARSCDQTLCFRFLRIQDVLWKFNLQLRVWSRITVPTGRYHPPGLGKPFCHMCGRA